MLYQTHEEPCSSQICWLPLDRIIPREDQPFGREDSPAMARLCESIRRDGLIHPITVQQAGEGRFAVVSGNRRLLGLSHIDAIVLPGAAPDAKLTEALELLRSCRLHYLEEARILAEVERSQLMEREELARYLGVTPAVIREKVRLMELDEGLRVLLMEQLLPERIARALLRLPDSHGRMTIALRAAREKLGVRDVELLVTSALSRLPAPPGPGGRTISLMRDHRLYLNAIRAIAAQMEEAGVPARMTERTLPDAVEVTLRLPTRKRRRSPGQA